MAVQISYKEVPTIFSYSEKEVVNVDALLRKSSKRIRNRFVPLMLKILLCLPYCN